MNTIHAILDGARLVHSLPILKIVETGVADTIDIATWCSKNSAATFVSVDLDAVAQEKNHAALEQLNAASSYTYRTQDHNKFLMQLTWIDIAFLNPENLQDGLEEFKLALSAGARTIIMRDYQSRAYLAVKQAKRFGWEAHFTGDYSILIRATN
jgi:hypothetical protein